MVSVIESKQILSELTQTLFEDPLETGQTVIGSILSRLMENADEWVCERYDLVLTRFFLQRVEKK